ncbi:helix-turn-helix domain-containing protein [Tabrizicola sp. SY72]|nr:helix-turn-helix domain-containing protein [Tabrizicola sp. SY72]
MTHPNDLLTSADTAALLGIKRGTLELWRQKGQGPKFVKLGTASQAHIRYRRSDVAAFIEQRLYASTSHYTAALATLRPDVKRAGGASE